VRGDDRTHDIVVTADDGCVVVHADA
jgi:hypothetical protein